MEAGPGSSAIPALTGPPRGSGTCYKVHLPDLFNKSNSCSLLPLLSLVVMTGCLNMLLLLWGWPGGLVFALPLVDSSNDGDYGSMWGGQEQCLQGRGAGR